MGHFPFIHPLTADALYASCSAEPDRDATVDDDHGHLTAALGVAEHALEIGLLLLDVEVLDMKPASGVVLTGRQGVRSGVLTEDLN